MSLLLLGYTTTTTTTTTTTCPPWYFSSTQDSTGYTEKSTDTADINSDIAGTLSKLSSQKGKSNTVATADIAAA